MKLLSQTMSTTSTTHALSFWLGTGAGSGRKDRMVVEGAQRLLLESVLRRLRRRKRADVNIEAHAHALNMESYASVVLSIVLRHMIENLDISVYSGDTHMNTQQRAYRGMLLPACMYARTGVRACV